MCVNDKQNILSQSTEYISRSGNSSGSCGAGVDGEFFCLSTLV